MAFEELNTAESRKKHLGIIEDVLAVNSYSTPLVTSSDAVTLQGRSFTVATGNTTELKDYKRNKDNEFDHVEVEEKIYTLEEEKYWGRFVDQLDERDSNGQVNIDYVLARQTAEVVAPYLDKLRFDAALGNVSENVVMGKEKAQTTLTMQFLTFLKNWMNSESLKNVCSLSLQASTKRSNLKSFIYHKVTQIRKSLEKDMLVNWMTTQSTKYHLNSCQM